MRELTTPLKGRPAKVRCDLRYYRRLDSPAWSTGAAITLNLSAIVLDFHDPELKLAILYPILFNFANSCFFWPNEF